jgi:hypothetical protein
MFAKLTDRFLPSGCRKLNLGTKTGITKSPCPFGQASGAGQLSNCGFAITQHNQAPKNRSDKQDNSNRFQKPNPKKDVGFEIGDNHPIATILRPQAAVLEPDSVIAPHYYLV